jgi:hypothetical protein
VDRVPREALREGIADVLVRRMGIAAPPVTTAAPRRKVRA